MPRSRARPGRYASVGLALAAVASLPRSAHATDWHLDADVVTDFPVDVGVRARVEGPYRLRLTTSLGVMPGAYVRTINALAEGVGWYTTSEGDLIEAALQTSLVWRTHLGWRPFPRLGFHFDAGYGLVTLGGSATAEELIAGVTGRPPPMSGSGTGTGGYTYNATATMHMIDAEVGWEFGFVRDRLVLDLALGFAGTLAASCSITPAYTPRSPAAVAAFANYGASYLQGLLTSYVFTPVATLAVGYRFF